MTPSVSVVPRSGVEPVKIVFERHVRPGADAAFREWSQRFVQTATRFPGHEGASVLAVPNSDSQFVLVRFASAADLEQWQRSDEYVALMREADTLGPAGEYSETRTGMETWFTLPGKPMPAKPPAKWKMALTTWVALLPMVVALGYIFGTVSTAGAVGAGAVHDHSGRHVDVGGDARAHTFAAQMVVPEVTT